MPYPLLFFWYRTFLFTYLQETIAMYTFIIVFSSSFRWDNHFFELAFFGVCMNTKAHANEPKEKNDANKYIMKKKQRHKFKTTTKGMLLLLLSSNPFFITTSPLFLRFQCSAFIVHIQRIAPPPSRPSVKLLTLQRG